MGPCEYTRGASGDSEDSWRDGCVCEGMVGGLGGASETDVVTLRFRMRVGKWNEVGYPLHVS